MPHDGLKLLKEFYKPCLLALFAGPGWYRRVLTSTSDLNRAWVAKDDIGPLRRSVTIRPPYLNRGQRRERNTNNREKSSDHPYMIQRQEKNQAPVSRCYPIVDPLCHSDCRPSSMMSCLPLAPHNGLAGVASRDDS
jgi:hypothetical protein